MRPRADALRSSRLLRECGSADTSRFSWSSRANRSRSPAVRSASRCWRANGNAPFAARERIVRSQAGPPIATFCRVAPACCGALADARRIVAGDGGGRVRTRSARQVARAMRLRRNYAVQSVGGPSASRSPPFDPVREASDKAVFNQRAHRHFLLRCAPTTVAHSSRSGASLGRGRRVPVTSSRRNPMSTRGIAQNVSPSVQIKQYLFAMLKAQQASGCDISCANVRLCNTEGGP